MTTVANTLVTAIVAVLQEAPAVCAHIDRVRLRPVAKGVDQAVAIRPAQTEVAEVAGVSGVPVQWVTAVHVECYAKSPASVAPDVAVDPLLEAVYARLMADPTLGGVALSLQPKGVSYDFDADGEHSTCASLVFHVRQRAAGNTLT